MKLFELQKGSVSQKIDQLRNVKDMQEEAKFNGMAVDELQKTYKSDNFKKYKMAVLDLAGDDDYWYGPSQRIIMYGFLQKWTPSETMNVIKGYGHPRDDSEEDMDYTERSMRRGEMGQH